MTPEHPVCVAQLDERIKAYFRLPIIQQQADILRLSCKEQLFRKNTDITFEVVEIGDVCRNNVVKIRFPEGIWCECGGGQMFLDKGHCTYIEQHWIEIVSGSLGKVPKRGKIHMGSAGLWGRLSKGISSGRAFRGR